MATIALPGSITAASRRVPKTTPSTFAAKMRRYASSEIAESSDSPVRDAGVQAGEIDRPDLVPAARVRDIETVAQVEDAHVDALFLEQRDERRADPGCPAGDKGRTRKHGAYSKRLCASG